VIRTRFLIACLWVVVLATGCTHVVGGAVRPAANVKPRPLSGQTVKQVLFDDAALSKIFNQPFEGSKMNRSWFGGPDKLRSSGRDASSRPECFGVTELQEKSEYASDRGAADVKDVAGQAWWHTGGSAKVMVVEEGIVTLPTAVAANALFTKFIAQWQQCAGATVTVASGNYTFNQAISDVRVADSVLAATVSVTSDMSPTDPSAIPHARAVGIRVNCVVEVDVAFYSSTDLGDRGSADVNTSGIDLAHRMMDRVSALT
jgi:PknH-like extracellular domain